MPAGIPNKRYEKELPCGHKGVIIWESGKTIAVRCQVGHPQHSKHQYPVYIIETEETAKVK